MTEEARTLTIDQALFGYADGHRQLAASMALTSTDSYELATRSDLAPGARLGPKASYIRGFALKDSGAFAYVKTWQAPEMPRPGCVWSHVLLLPRAFLAGQVDLGVLHQLFRRPTAERGSDDYGGKVDVQRFAKGHPADAREVERIVMAYYGSGQLSLEDAPSEAFERALLAVWSQQWPRLRLEFVFRTEFDGAASPEPGLTVRVAFRGERLGSVPLGKASSTEWSSAAVADATSPGVTPLRRFLWRYGKDVFRPRRAFRTLVRLYLAERREIDAGRFAAEVLRRFPEALDAATLKRDLLGVKASALPLVPRVDGGDFVRFAANGRVLADRLVESGELLDVVASFGQKDLRRAAVALGKLDLEANPEAALIEESVARLIGLEALADAEVPSRFVVDVLRRRPNLLDGFDAERIDVADAIDLLGFAKGCEARRRLLRRLLTSPPTNGGVGAVHRFPGDALSEAASLSIAGLLAQGWRDAFSEVARDALREALPDLKGARALSHAVDLIGFCDAIDVRASEVATAAGRLGSTAAGGELVILDAFLLVLSLRQGLASAMPVVLDVLPRLREVALADGFAPRVRTLLDGQLPQVAESWDLNRRLLKVLRGARREGYDVAAALRRMDLSERELSYVLDEEEKTVQEVLMKLLWPW